MLILEDYMLKKMLIISINVSNKKNRLFIIQIYFIHFKIY